MVPRDLSPRDQYRLDQMRHRLATLIHYGNQNAASGLADEILNLLGYGRKP